MGILLMSSVGISPMFFPFLFLFVVFVFVIPACARMTQGEAGMTREEKLELRMILGFGHWVFNGHWVFGHWAFFSSFGIRH